MFSNQKIISNQRAPLNENFFRMFLHECKRKKRFSSSFSTLCRKTRYLVIGITMCDFHNFGLIFAGQMHCLPQRLKSTLFEIFSNGGCPKGTRSVEKISNNVDFSLWGNRATTWEYFLTFSSETKIMKITHSASWVKSYAEKLKR